MMLPANFELDKYGLHVRLVNEKDANFIVKLRTDPKLGRFIHLTDNDVEKQREWIRQYKVRENEGKDYYFTYYFNDEPIGVNRIYDIESTYATGGSWICKSGLPMELPILTLIILREIIFEILNLSYDRFDVRKKNFQVLRIHKLFGANKTFETELDCYFELSKESFEQKKSYVLDLLNINE